MVVDVIYTLFKDNRFFFKVDILDRNIFNKCKDWPFKKEFNQELLNSEDFV